MHWTGCSFPPYQWQQRYEAIKGSYMVQIRGQNTDISRSLSFRIPAEHFYYQSLLYFWIFIPRFTCSLEGGGVHCRWKQHWYHYFQKDVIKVTWFSSFGSFWSFEMFTARTSRYHITTDGAWSGRERPESGSRQNTALPLHHVQCGQERRGLRRCS